MDITCYLPDELGKLAKEADLPFSLILRRGVLDALGMEEPPVKPKTTAARLADLEFRIVQLESIQARLQALEETVTPDEDEHHCFCLCPECAVDAPQAECTCRGTVDCVCKIE